MTIDDPTPYETHQLDQAAVDAFDDVDHLANDPETARRLERVGPAVYAAQLAADLDANVFSRMGLAGFAAMATIRRVQERAEADRMRTVVDAAARVVDLMPLEHGDVDDLEAVQGEADNALVDAVRALRGEPVEPTSTAPRFTVQYALDTMTDLGKLRRLAKQYFEAMLAQHQFAGHLVDAECTKCAKARETCDPADACDEYKQWQRQYENAVGAL